MILYDTAEVRKLSQDLGRASAKVVPAVHAVVRKGADNIKRDMVAEATAGSDTGYYRAFPHSITYDMRATLGAIEYQIGPDKLLPQGALGNILYFGTSKNAPELNLLGPLEREEPNFMAALLAAAEGTLSDDRGLF